MLSLESSSLTVGVVDSSPSNVRLILTPGDWWAADFQILQWLRFYPWLSVCACVMVTPWGNKGVPGDRDNARNKGRCTQVRKTTHGLDGRYQDVDRTPRGRVSQNDRGQRQMEKVRPWCGQPSDRGRLKNRTACIRSILISSHGFLHCYGTSPLVEVQSITILQWASLYVCLCGLSSQKRTIR